MTYEDTPGLSPKQAEGLRTFIGVGATIHRESAGQVHAFDQATSDMKDRLQKEGASLDTLEDYFSVLAGLSIGATCILRIVEAESALSIGEAGDLLKVVLGRLAPSTYERLNVLENPTHSALYDAVGIGFGDQFTDRLELDLADPLVFCQVAAGVLAAVDYMQGLERVGYDTGYAALMTVAVASQLAPLQT